MTANFEEKAGRKPGPYWGERTIGAVGATAGSNAGLRRLTAREQKRRLPVAELDGAKAMSRGVSLVGICGSNLQHLPSWGFLQQQGGTAAVHIPLTIEWSQTIATS